MGRRGWRKQPTREGRVRLRPSFRHISGARVCQTNEGDWYFHYHTDEGYSLNSLWRDSDHRFDTATLAMIAAEESMRNNEAKDYADG